MGSHKESWKKQCRKRQIVKITGAEYDTGKLSYQKVNQKLITGNVISSNKSGNAKARKRDKRTIAKASVYGRSKFG